MLVEFDPAKNARNIAERGLSFAWAGEFAFSSAVIAVDRRKAYPEVRYVALGMLHARLHVLHAHRRRDSSDQFSQGKQPGDQGI